MIKILVYNTDKIRFPFTVKRKRHGNFQRRTRNTGGDAAAAFAGATAGRRKNRPDAHCPVTRKRKTANARSPWAALPMPGALCVTENVDDILQVVNVMDGDKLAGKNSALPEPIKIHYRYDTKGGQQDGSSTA